MSYRLSCSLKVIASRGLPISQMRASVTLASKMENVRIVHLVETLEVGGVERLTVDLAQKQNTGAHSARIYCVFQPGALAKKSCRPE